MKITYEIIRIEKDRIFIIPNIFDQTENTLGKISNQIKNYCEHIYENFKFKKIIFGFRKFSFKHGTEYEWKLAKSYRAGPAGMGACNLYCFEKYEGEVPQESEVTGFPSSFLFYL